MIVDIIGYREWAKTIYDSIRVLRENVHFHEDIESACKSTTTVTFLVGWSEIVPESFYDSHDVFVLHPSPLPYYRGGSPIQHQIINGEKVSAVTIFKLDKQGSGIDCGPIAIQVPYSLEGNLEEILNNIAMVGYRSIMMVLENISCENLALLPQVGSYPTYKRRKPEESEITKEELKEKSAKYLYNKIRALQDPYPNAFIQTNEGKLYITGAYYQ